MNVPGPSVRRRQIDRSAASTAAMLDAAIELILEQGANVSMMAIGQRSGFSHGLVLARFGSKAGLNEAVAREAQRRFAETVDAATDAKGTATLHRIIEVFFQVRLKAGGAFFVLLGASLGQDPQLRAAFAQADRAFRRYMQSHLQDAQTIGEVDPAIDARAMATLLVGMLRGVAMQYRISPEEIDIKAVGAEAHALVARLGRVVDTDIETSGSHRRLLPERQLSNSSTAPLGDVDT